MLFKIIKYLLYIISTPQRYARYIGVNIGNNNFIATKNFGTEPYLITIGNNCQITDNVFFHTHGGAHIARRLYPNFDVFGKIKVEDWVYIGSSTHILPGVTVGKGSLIAACSVVTRSIPAGEVWGGIPAHYICSADEYIKKNSDYNVNSKQLSARKKRKLLLSLPDEKFITK